MALDTQLGYANESTFGTLVTPNRFSWFNSENIRPDKGVTQSRGRRAGQRLPQSSQRRSYYRGSGGPIELEVLTKGFGFWLKYMLGAVATSAQGDDDEYVHTGSIATMCGDSFTMEVNRPLGACGDTAQGFRWGGGKLASWSLDCQAPDGLLTFSAETLFASEAKSTIATASYPSGAEALCWLDAYLTWGGSPLLVTGWTVNCNNHLKDDRYKLGLSGRQEPVEIDDREITIDLTCDWTSTDHYDDFMATTADNNVAITLGAIGPTAIGGTTYPELKITAPTCGIENAGTNIEGPDQLMEPITLRVLDSGFIIEYTTADATP